MLACPDRRRRSSHISRAHAARNGSFAVLAAASAASNACFERATSPLAASSARSAQCTTAWTAKSLVSRVSAWSRATHCPASNDCPRASIQRTRISQIAANTGDSSSAAFSRSNSVTSSARPCHSSASARTAYARTLTAGSRRGASSTARHTPSASTNAASAMRAVACQRRASIARSSHRADCASLTPCSSDSNAAAVRPRSSSILASVIPTRDACRPAPRRASAASTSRSNRSAAA